MRDFGSREAGDWCGRYCSGGIVLSFAVGGIVGDGLSSGNVKIRWKSTALK